MCTYPGALLRLLCDARGMRIARPCCALLLAAGCWSAPAPTSPSQATSPQAEPSTPTAPAEPATPRPRPPTGPRGDDRDADGFPDRDDKCPTDTEDYDSFEDGDGCPDLDNDLDGILDVDDLCPVNPEDKDGDNDADGCPEP